MTNSTSHTPELSREEFNEEVRVLVVAVVTNVLKPSSPLRTTVVLAALLQLYRLHAQSLPAAVQRQLSVAVAALAGELLQADHPAQSVPAGTTTH